MAATTPEDRIAAAVSGISISRTTRAIHAVDAARVQCWAAGRGWPIVPCHAPLATIGGSVTAFRYRVLPRFQDIRYAFHFVMSASSRTGCAIEVPEGSTGVLRAVQTHSNAFPITVLYDPASQSAAERALDFGIASTGDDIVLESVAIEALPRALLQTGNADLGSDRFEFWPRNPILEANVFDQFLADNDALRAACRRAQFQHSFGDTSPWSTNDTSFDAIFPGGVNLLGRYLFNGDTTRTLNGRILAYCSDGTTAGEFRITMTNGDSVTVTIPAGTTGATWLPSTSGSPFEIDVDAEDNTSSDGRRSSRWDMATMEARRTAGAGDVLIETISIWEPAE